MLYLALAGGAFLLLTSTGQTLAAQVQQVVAPGTAPIIPVTTPTPGQTGLNVVTPSGLPSNVIQAYGTYLLAGSPAPPLVYSKPYFVAYELPAHILVNPNVALSSYTLTPAEAQQYMQNYLDIAQFANQATSVKKWGSPTAAAQYHWHTYGVADQRSFLPINPPDGAPYLQPVANKNASGSAWVGTALTIAASVVKLLGPNDPQLNQAEAQTLITGAAIMKEILPYYYKTDPKLANAIAARLDGLLKQYTAS